MFFNSYSFLVFGILFFAIFYVLNQRRKLEFLLLSSYVFYSWWNPMFLGLILLSTVVDYNVANKIYAETNQKRRKSWLWFSVMVNLSILGFFKYFNFFADSFQALFELAGFHTSGVYLDVVLPVGISFYTFQTIGYTVDVYRKKIKPERSKVRFALYVAYFPQLVAGPIERAGQLLPQFASKLRPTARQIKEGVWLITWGFFLKVVIADNLAPVVEDVFGYRNPYVASKNIWPAALAFCLQIYGDFAGYSKIARGVSKFISIDLRMNFWNPLFATSPSDFWRRWHITLSQWLKDYLYISLGGNRVGQWLTIRNLMITMLLGGLWHGASWIFVIWGFYHGLLLILYRLLGLVKMDTSSWAWRLPKWVVMTLLSLYGWLIFRAQSMEQLVEFSRQFWGFNFDWVSIDVWLVNVFWICVFYVIVIANDLIAERRRSEYTLSLDKWFHLMPLFTLFVVIYLLRAQHQEFIYFQF